MDYQYDVFISYRNFKKFGKWVPETFYEEFETYLAQHFVPKGARIFLDRKEILTGQDWKERIQEGLLASKVLVPILIPEYFASEWCLREYAVFHHRQKHLGGNPPSLILPIRLFDGEYFPPYASDKQMRDFRDYHYGPINDKSEIYKPFCESVLSFAQRVKQAVNDAPPFNPNWVNDPTAWCEKPYSNLKRQTTRALKMTSAPKPFVP